MQHAKNPDRVAEMEDFVLIMLTMIPLLFGTSALCFLKRVSMLPELHVADRFRAGA
jgi:hypothetical protein